MMRTQQKSVARQHQKMHDRHHRRPVQREEAEELHRDGGEDVAVNVGSFFEPRNTRQNACLMTKHERDWAHLVNQSLDMHIGTIDYDNLICYINLK